MRQRGRESHQTFTSAGFCAVHYFVLVIFVFKTLQNVKPLRFVYSWLENVSLLDLLINSLNYQFSTSLPVRERDKEKQDFICSLYFYLQTENVNRFRRAFRKHLNIYEEAFCENSDDLHHKRCIKQIQPITTLITPKNGYHLLKHTRQLVVRTIGKCTTQYIIKIQDTKATREHVRIQESLRIIGSLSI